MSNYMEKFWADDFRLFYNLKEAQMNEPKYRTVTAEDLSKLQAHLRAREDAVLKVKGHDYTHGGPDRLANFIEASAAIGVRPEVVWAVYFHKHVTAILTWSATGRLESEDLLDRFVDIRNYCLLGLALHDANPKYNPPKEPKECPHP